MAKQHLLTSSAPASDLPETSVDFGTESILELEPTGIVGVGAAGEEEPRVLEAARPVVPVVLLSKSERIRQLVFVEGFTQYRAAKILGVLPQFVSNVVRAERIRRAKVADAASPTGTAVAVAVATTSA